MVKIYRRFEIPFIPRPQKRPRDKGNQTYDPQASLKNQIRTLFRALYKEVQPYDFPMKAQFTYHMPIPKSYSKKKRAFLIGKIHTISPDLSNLIKFTEDTFNNVIWKDEALLTDIHAKKVYGKFPKTEIVVSKYLIYK